MAKPDEAHIRTDQELAALEKRITAEYKKASDELQGKINDYFEKLKKRDAEQKKLIGEIVNGKEYTEQDYQQWRLAQIGRGKRFEALRDRVAERMTNANETAAAYINDTTPGVYSLNRNYAAYTIEREVGAVGFDLWDERTVRRLIVERPDSMPYYPPERAVKRGFDLAFGKRQITAQITSGILQGESIKRLADRLQVNIPNMNRTSAIRAARTAVTGAQNAGRLDSYIRAEEMGIGLKKQWLATLDGRTRHAHQLLDGQTQDNDKPFHSELGDIMFPGDPGAEPANVYNCRCTLVADIEGVNTSGAFRRDREGLLFNMTYTEWADTKRGEGLIAADRYAQKEARREARDRKQFEEYKAILGKNAPKSFAKFRDLKYNDPEEWEYIKRFANYMRKYPNSDKRYFDVHEELKKLGINTGVILPPIQKQAFILPSGKRDPYHIMHRMIERNMTDDDIRGYMKNASVMATQWGGQRQKFISNSGVCIIMKTNEGWVYRTAWTKQDFDEEFETIMRVIKNVGL